ncbi:hypothetical protein RHMOL_Rhmol09G0052500 [Rhododendron molle]|uniref:Uncharacterized protein n=1 Tax=Rhododendron molle TaxID=49168 RepID=A0ACC0MA99_RHOML|nr:hypothetical protein RHMOL_Rhmol09G0052500 [Rhododendron molle]
MGNKGSRKRLQDEIRRARDDQRRREGLGGGEDVGCERRKKVKKKINGENGEEEEGEWPARSYGKYSFRIALPENVQFEKIKAGVRDGVLYISIPKAEFSSKVLDINVE